jgi:hypothetical protein
LTAVGITAEKIVDLRTKDEAYSSAIGAKESSIADRKGARESMNELFAKADELIHAELDLYMEMVRPVDPELYHKYFAARIVKDMGVRHRAVAEPEPAGAAPAAPAPAVTGNGVLQ